MYFLPVFVPLGSFAFEQEDEKRVGVFLDDVDAITPVVYRFLDALEATAYRFVFEAVDRFLFGFGEQGWIGRILFEPLVMCVAVHPRHLSSFSDLGALSKCLQELRLHPLTFYSPIFAYWGYHAISPQTQKA